jgi:ribosome biogenesis GTPase
MMRGSEHMGFTSFFAAQLTTGEISTCLCARVIEVQRSEIVASDGEREFHLRLGGHWHDAASEDRPSVGDWVVLDATHTTVLRVLERKSAFRRVAAGDKPVIQIVAANIDFLFIVTSCNEEFKESRLERYVALAHEAGVTPVVVLTKIDLTADYFDFIDRARSVERSLAVEAVNALDHGTLASLEAWIEPGCTVALVGSSGVGKSTLVNSLTGQDSATTAGIREDDAKGRHTTTFRSIHRLANGGLLIDVPGMRELKVPALGDSLLAVFSDIQELAAHCRFADCRHEAEPACAVRAALDTGSLDPRRWANYQKLRSEAAHHGRSLAEKHARERRFGMDVKRMMAHKRDLGLKR